ncbi:MAG: hypothetical protein R3F59_20025 [Myxococcota bacterium]
MNAVIPALLAGVALAADPPDPLPTLRAAGHRDHPAQRPQVLLLEDHRTDTVALHLAYGVGARDERLGELAARTCSST